LGTGKVVTLTVNLSEAVTVAGGTPTLTLNNGGTATYAGGSGSNTLTFSYTVAAGQNTSDLAVTAFNLNAATVKDSAGNAANLGGAVSNPSGTLQIETTAPTVSSVVTSGTGITSGSGTLGSGKVVTLTVNLSEAVTVAGGTPTLTLNNGGTATYAGGSGSNALTFSYTVAAGQNTSDLAVTAFNLNAATVKDSAGNAANLGGAVSNPSGTLQIETRPDLTEYVAVNKTTVTAGSSLTVDAYNMNLGNTVASTPTTAGIYISTDATITTLDTLLTTISTTGTLATVSQPGYYDRQKVTVTLPGNLAPGTYYIGGIADYNNQLSESNETNNTYNVVQVTVAAPPQPDLTEYVAVNKTTVAAGSSLTVDAYNMNLGKGGAATPTTAGIYISTDATITTSDTLLTTISTTGTLATVSQPGYYDRQTVTVTLPGNLAPGTYYIGGIADYNNQLGESNETNNTYNVVQVTVAAPPQPDLTEYVAVDKTTAAAGSSLTVDAYNMNIGKGGAATPTTAGIYISTDATITTSDTLLATISTTGTLATVSQPGYYDRQTVTVTLPGNLAPGAYYIGGIADYNNQLGESNETNNTYNVVQVTVAAPTPSNSLASSDGASITVDQTLSSQAADSAAIAAEEQSSTWMAAIDQRLALWAQHVASAFPTSATGISANSTQEFGGQLANLTASHQTAQSSQQLG
ncbi:hypothetical protein IVB41_32570, partial [Bradyrhizobium sp. 44]|uniref:CARDB domain-containing protein n=1 Tax=Bradyrhizobium sp. 44 TaxID=2782675 RepID=UPI0023EE32DA